MTFLANIYSSAVILPHLHITLKMNLLSYFLTDEVEGVEIRGDALFSLTVRFQRNKQFTILPASYNKPSAVAISSTETLFRSIVIPKVSSQEKTNLIRSALESTVSIPIDDYEITTKDSNGTTSCFLTPKAELQKIYSELLQHELKPTWLFPKALCITEALEQILLEPKPLLVLDIDQKEMTFLLISNKSIVDVKTTQGAEEIASEESWKPMREIARILLAWQEKYSYSQEAQLLITGNISQEEQEKITNFLRKELYTTKTIDTHTRAHLPAIGAALLSHNTNIFQSQCGFQIATCIEEETRVWQKPLILFGILLLILSGLTYGIGNTFLAAREVTLASQFKKLVSLTYPEEPKELTLDFQSLADYETALDQVENQLKAKDLYPITADTPQMSEVLIWLSQLADTASKESEGQPLELAQIQYALVKRPDKTRPKDHYQVRVDVEFTAGSASQARKMHEELLTPNAFIDPKQEVKWSLNGGKWRTSFVLKDKTVYFP